MRLGKASYMLSWTTDLDHTNLLAHATDIFAANTTANLRETEHFFLIPPSPKNEENFFCNATAGWQLCTFCRAEKWLATVSHQRKSMMGKCSLRLQPALRAYFLSLHAKVRIL